MSEDPQPPAADGASPAPGWQRALDDLERSLRDAGHAVTLLRRSLEGDGLPARPAEAAPTGASARPAGAAPTGAEAPAPAPAPATSAEDPAALSAFERVWDRIEREKGAKQDEPPSEPPSERRGLDLLPQQYLLTVEDREGEVDLASLHRAVLSLERIEEFSLVSYANGVPVISLRVAGELDLEQLSGVVARAMDRQCEAIPRDNGRLYLRMTARQD